MCIIEWGRGWDVIYCPEALSVEGDRSVNQLTTVLHNMGMGESLLTCKQLPQVDMLFISHCTSKETHTHSCVIN